MRRLTRAMAIAGLTRVVSAAWPFSASTAAASSSSSCSRRARCCCSRRSRSSRILGVVVYRWWGGVCLNRWHTDQHSRMKHGDEVWGATFYLLYGTLLWCTHAVLTLWFTSTELMAWVPGCRGTLWSVTTHQTGCQRLHQASVAEMQRQASGQVGLAHALLHDPRCCWMPR